MNALFLKSFTAFVFGCILFLLISFTIYRKSYFYQKARAKAQGEEEPSKKSLLVTLFIMALMVLSLGGFNLWVLAGGERSILYLFLLNLGLITSLSLFDALVIDILLLLVWRPSILNLPAGQPTREYMKRHIQIQFTKGWIFKLPMALIGAVIGLLLNRFLFVS